MKRIMFWICAVIVGYSAHGQVQRVGKGIIPEDQAFGFSMTTDKKTAFFVRSYSGRDTLILYTMESKNGKWQTPKPVSFSGKPGVWRDIDPFVTMDGKRLFFQSNRGVKAGDLIQKHFDIWVADKTARGWSEPKHLGPIVNSDSSESFLSTTEAGKIYFGSNRAGGVGKIDIYTATFVNGDWQSPVNVGPVINTVQHDTNPFVAHDESFLIMTKRSDRPNADSDLYISFNINGNWTKPQNIGNEINSDISEFCPFMLPGEDTLYFARLDKKMRFNENIYKAPLNVKKLRALFND